MVWWRKEKADCKAVLGHSTLWHLESDRGSFSEANYMGFGLPGGTDGKESACNVGDPGSIPGSGRSPREGNGYPLQYSCLENSTEEPGRLQSTGSQSQTLLNTTWQLAFLPGHISRLKDKEWDSKAHLPGLPQCPKVQESSVEEKELGVGP